jgi:hypothetical protein
VSQSTGVCDICGKTWVGGHVCSYSNSTLLSGSESYHGKLGKPYKGPVEPSPLVIAADQLAQAAEKLRGRLTKSVRYLSGEPLTKVTLSPNSWEIAQEMQEFDTALANYKRVREG